MTEMCKMSLLNHCLGKVVKAICFLLVIGYWQLVCSRICHLNMVKVMEREVPK